MEKSAVVIGGSIAGLMHAIMLKKHGYSVTVLEQHATPRSSYAAGMKAGPEVVKFLEKYDITGCEYSIVATKTVFTDKKGKTLLEIPGVQRLTSWGLLYNILRANYDGKTFAACQTIPSGHSKGDGLASYLPGRRATDIQQTDAGGLLIQYFTSPEGAPLAIKTDLAIAADGTNSYVRSLLQPEERTKYAGYVTWRGTVPDRLVSVETRAVFEGVVTVHLLGDMYILCYVIPRDEGVMARGDRLLNWVWYYPLPDDSPEFTATMTDINGKTHANTVPQGLVVPNVWERQKDIATSIMCAPFSELVSKTEVPFVHKVGDRAGKQAAFLNNKVLLVGDALATLRPHIALSSNQAALHCNLLEEVLEGKQSMAAWQRAVVKYGRSSRLLSIVVGNVGLASKIVLLWSAVKYLVFILGQKLRLVA